MTALFLIVIVIIDLASGKSSNILRWVGLESVMTYVAENLSETVAGFFKECMDRPL